MVIITKNSGDFSCDQQICDIHKEYKPFFFEYSEKGIEKWGCHICASKPAQHNRVFVKALEDSRVNDIIYNMPPLEDGTYEQIQQVIDSDFDQNDLQAELMTLKVNLIKKIERIFENLSFLLIVKNDDLVTAYNNILEKERLKQLIQQPYANQEEISHFIRKLHENKSQNNKTIHEIIRQINYQKKVVKEDLPKFIDEFSTCAMNKFFQQDFMLSRDIMQQIREGKYFTKDNMIIQKDQSNFYLTKTEASIINLIDVKLTKDRFNQQFKVKVINKTDWIGLGICSKLRALKEDFVFNRRNDSACTIISSNGFKWFLNNEGVSQYTDGCFEFNNDDIIQFVIEPHQLIAKKMNEDFQVINIAVLPLSFDEHEEYCPCIVLSSQNDEIQFIND